MMKLLAYFLCFCILGVRTLDAQTTKIQHNGVGFTFMRDGKPYYVKGVGGEVNLEKAVQIGANSIRTWGVENAQKVLDEAHKNGLTVMLGLWLQHERHGFDYDNKEKVLKQLNYFKTIIEKFKDHPALLMWGIGNELDLQYSNTNVWYAVQDLAKFVHQVDPNHPTSTVTAGLDSMEVQLIKSRAPDIDVYCVNTYGDIANVPNNIERFGWSGPYMITEWGVNGYWESAKTPWNVSIEQTSTEKKRVFYERYKRYIEPNTAKCLGSYAFLWGAKQEYTETWFGLFSKDNKVTEPIDALEMIFKGTNPALASPTVLSMQLDGKGLGDTIKVKAEARYSASVVAKMALNMTEMQEDAKKELVYEWKVLAESKDKKSGGDAEQEAQEVRGLIRGSSSQISLRAPGQAGAYRLFVTVHYNGKVAYANIPFWVNERSLEDGPSRFIEFKKTTMSSFNRDNE